MNRFALPLIFAPACTQFPIANDEVIPVESPGAGNAGDSGACGEEACAGGVLVSSPLVPDQGICLQFLESHSDAGLLSSSSHTGIAVGDYDGDTREDIFVMNASGSHQMFKNLGGTFGESAEVGTFSGRAAAFADYDGDGDLDLAITGEDGLAIYKNNSGVFSELTSSGISNSGSGASVVWVESGFLFATENGTRFYEYEGGDHFVDVTDEAGLDDDAGSGSFIAVADYDGDHRDDIFVANETGQNRLFRNLGSGVFESVEESLGVSGSGSVVSTGAAWATLRGESEPSLYVANWDGGNEFYVRDGGGFTDVAGVFGLRDAGDTTNVSGATLHEDLDPVFFLGRSGQPDLIYIPAYDSYNELKSYEDAGEGLGLDDNGVNMGSAWFDYDDDGDLDLITVMYDGSLKLYQNQTQEVELCED